MNWLVEKMKEDGSKNAIIFKGKEYTYEALVEQIESYYIIISKQINQGEIVSVISDYSFQAIALFLHCMKIGMSLCQLLQRLIKR